MKDFYYSKYYSTGIIIWHMNRHHKDTYKNHLEAKVDEKLAVEGKGEAQQFIKPFHITCPNIKQSLYDCYIPATLLL